MLLSSEDKLLLSCVKIHPSTVDIEELNHLLPLIKDWENLCTLLIVHGSAPLFCKKLPLLSNSKFIPAVVQSKLQQTYYKTLSRSMLLYQAFAQVISALQAEGIQPIVLKGAYLSECLYGDIALRQFSDLDLLVAEADGKRSLEVLTKNGFTAFDPSVSEFISEQTEIVHYPPMVKGAVSVEIHIRLHRKNSRYAIQIEDFIKQVVPVTINHKEVYALQLYDLLVHLCVHIDKHFAGGHIQMKCFNDIANLLDLHASAIDWDSFIANCRLHSAEQIVMQYLIMTHEFYGSYLPENIVAQYQALLLDKDRGRFMQYLHCEYDKKYHVNTHWHNIREIKSTTKQIRYFVELILPPKRFMMEKYNIGSQPLKGSKTTHFNNSGLLGGLRTRCWFLWYPYRWWVGVKGLVKLVFRKALNG